MTNACEIKLVVSDEPRGLPPCAHIADEHQVMLSIARIKQILARTVQRGSEEVGQHLLDTFYGGDIEAYLSSHPNKHVSLRLLMSRCGTVELPVNKVFLARAIQMAALARRLPRQSRFLALPMSHRLELLKIKSVDTLERLATRALEANMSVHKVRDMVRKEALLTKSTRGRKPIPSVIRAINACMRTLGDEDTGELLVQRGDVEQLNAEQVGAARAQMELLQKRIAALAALLG